MKNLSLGIKYCILFLIGGFLYVNIEILFRGYSHISMYFAGGICFLLIGSLNEIFPWKISLTTQMLFSAFIITFVEFTTGLVVNIWLKANVWDYSELPYNFMGQICLLYSILWFFLSLPAILLDDWLKYYFWGEEKPTYKV